MASRQFRRNSMTSIAVAGETNPTGTTLNSLALVSLDPPLLLFVHR